MTFTEQAEKFGIADSGYSIHASFFDYDKDGFLDMYLLNNYNSKPIGSYDLQQNLRNVRNHQGNMRFINRASEWEIDEPGFSNGSAYGDLNGDGTLDLVVNNVNMEALIYRNRAIELYPDRNWIQVELRGESPNSLGVGAQVDLIADGRRWYVEQMQQRGFQSSMDPTLHIGLGTEVPTIDRLQVHLPDGRISLKTGIKTKQRLIIKQIEAVASNELKLPVQIKKSENFILKDVNNELNIDWRHQESYYNNFKQFPLSFHMRSTEGPPDMFGRYK